MRRTITRSLLVAALSCVMACGGSEQGASYAPPASFGPNDATLRAPMEPEPAKDMDGVGDEMKPATVTRDFESVLAVAPGSASSGDMRMEMTRQVAPAAAPPAPPPPAQRPAGKLSTTPQTSTTPESARGSAQPGAAEAVAVRAPMLVYTAGIAMTVVEIKASLLSIEALTRELGGFLARRDNVSITIRVPVARFDEAVRRIETLGEVIHRNVSVEDVTEEFTDLEVRLQNLRAIRSRLEKLLEKAKGVEEAVLLERELGRVASEIDRIEGRMKLLRDRASYSTITVSLRERQREAIGPRGPRLPVDWLNRLGLGRLLQL